MKTILNTHEQGVILAMSLIKSGVVPCFDLDGVLLDACHRQATYSMVDYIAARCTNSDIGTLNLTKYRENSTAELIAQDQAMPLIAAIKILNNCGIDYHVVTARVACQHTRKLLLAKSIKPLTIMARQGEQDTRKDARLKTDHLTSSFSKDQLSNMVLIDDNMKNCVAVQAIGMRAYHVPFTGH